MYDARQGINGNVVHYFMSDYGSSGLRVYRFTPDHNLLTIVTYNPITGALCESTRIVPDVGRHQFTIYFPMR